MDEYNGSRIIENIMSENMSYTPSWNDDGGAYHDGGWNDSWPDGWSDSHR